MEKYHRRRSVYFHALSGGYCLLLLIVCVTRFNLIGGFLGIPPTQIESLNLIPFKSILGGVDRVGKLTWDALGNMVMFIPLGILFCYHSKRRDFLSSMGLCFAISCGIELLQYIFKTGAVDVDDVILNATGGVIGVLIFWFIFEISKKKINETKNIVEICSSVFPPFLLVYIADLFFGTNRYQFQLLHLGPILLYFLLASFLLLKDITAKGMCGYWCAVIVFGGYFFFVFL